MISWIETPEDMKWLQETKGIPVAGFSCAEMHGNEDCPRYIILFERNHIDSPIQEWKWDAAADKYVRVEQ